MRRSILFRTRRISGGGNKGPNELYNKAFQRKIWPYMEHSLDQKKVLAKGTYGVRNCHAGEKNLIIGADGSVYVCLTGAYYKERSRREAFCIGSLRQHTLDEILLDTARREEVRSHAVKLCEGCSNPCEVNREVFLFGQPVGLVKAELPAAFALEQQRRIGIALIDYEGWHEIERCGGDCLCWSSAAAANIFIPSQPVSKIRIAYRKLDAQSVVKLFADGREVFADRESDGHRVIMLELPGLLENGYTTITFCIDQVKTPYELGIGGDCRRLGVGLEAVTVCVGEDTRVTMPRTK